MLRQATIAFSVRCAATGQLGRAALSTVLPQTAMTSQANILVGQCIQTASPKPKLNRNVLASLAKQECPQTALERFPVKSAEFAERQILILDQQGRTAAFTGSNVTHRGTGTNAGHFCSDNLAIGWTGLTKEETPVEAAEVFKSSEGTFSLLSDRLLAMLKRCENSVGGLMSSALIEITGESHHPLLSLRVDTADNPAARLEEIYSDYMEEDIREDALLPAAEHPHGILPTQWGDTRRYLKRQWREARRSWANRNRHAP